MTYSGKAVLCLSLVVALSLGFRALGVYDFSAAAFLLVSVCFTCELIDSGLGMGYGTTLTPILLLLGYDPLDFVPTILISEFLSGITSAYFHSTIKNADFRWRGADLHRGMMLAGGSLLGVTLGVFFALNVPQQTLKVAIGCVITASGLFILVLRGRPLVFRVWKMLVLASVASFNKAVSGGGYGPLVTSGQILSGIRGKSAVAITSFSEALTCFFAVMLFWSQGKSLNLQILIPACTGALLSIPFSVFAVSKVKESHLKLLIGLLTVVLGLFTLLGQG